MLYEPEDRRISVFLRQNRFFDALEAFAPEVRLSLLDSVGACYERLSANPKFSNALAAYVDSECQDPECFRETTSEHAILLAVYEEWWRKWNLYDDWVKVVALRTVLRAIEYPALTNALLWSKSGESVWLADDMDRSDIVTRFSAWNPLGFVSAAKYEKDAVALLKIILSKRTGATIKILKDRNWKEVRHRFSEIHFRWLIDFQIYGRGVHLIARHDLGSGYNSAQRSGEFDKLKDNVKKSVKRLSDSIKLTLRTKI